MVWTKIKKNWFIIAVVVLASFLRLYNLHILPTSLFGDELDVGYQAYSLLKTGRDYSGNFLPLQPQSLAEWRTPLFIYSTIPFVAFWGITPISLRLLPSLMGILNVILVYIFVSKNFSNKKKFGLSLADVSAFVLAINPWHIQYSRAAFEVTEMITFILLGLMFFIHANRNKGKHLWLSVLFFLLAPWTYNTPKFFIPFFCLCLILIYWKEMLKLNIKEYLYAFLIGLLLGLPLLFNTLSGQGSARFNNISIFSDPTLEKVISENREIDTSMPKVFHNKITFFGSHFVENYLGALNPQFLFLYGDTNPRHSIEGQGLFYAIDLLLLSIGIKFFFSKEDKKIKSIVLSFILIGILPSALTIDGANHATRLILILVPLVILISYGLVHSKKLIWLIYLPFLCVCIFFFVHDYFVHNPINSQVWWHYGWSESISYIKEHQSEYERVVISDKGEPPQIFFLANYEYDPSLWQKKVTGKFYFHSFDNQSVYDLGSKLDNKTLYLATAKEVGIDLLHEPERTPKDLNLLHTVKYPSGDPAFYLFSKK